MDLEQQLRAALIPCRAGSALRAAVLVRVSAQATRRKPNRVILSGAILAVAAAAAMLAARLMHAPTLPAAATAPIPVPESVSSVTAANLRPSPRLVAAPAPTPVQAKQPSVPVIKPFTVRVLPLQNQATDAFAASAIERYYRALLDALRATPGLALITPDTVGAVAETPPDYQLTIRGTGPMSGGEFATELRAEAMGPDGRLHAALTSALSGEIAPACAGTGTGCADPAGLAATEIEMLRNTMFPTDRSQRRELENRVLDASLGSGQRLRALVGLETFQAAGPSAGGEPAGVASALRDPAVVHGAINLAATAVDPAQRAQVWRTMRGVRSPELLTPLISSLQQDPDGNVRVEAAATLAADFASDPQVRAVLEIAANQDVRPLVRALAQRGLSGDATWHRYVVTSLEDTRLQPAQRIEALFHAVRHSATSTTDLRDILDDDAAIRALAQVLPRAAKSLSRGDLTASVLISQLGAIDNPALNDMLIDSLASSDDPAFRRAVVSQLATRCGDPRVLARLEMMRTTDSDPQLRELAASLLKRAADPAAQPQSPTR